MAPPLPSQGRHGQLALVVQQVAFGVKPLQPLGVALRQGHHGPIIVELACIAHLVGFMGDQGELGGGAGGQLP